MAMRFSNKESKRPAPLTMHHHNKPAAADTGRRKPQPPQVADLTDFMNDMFFGTVSTETKSYNLTGEIEGYMEDSPNSSTASTPRSSNTTPSSNSKMTQEWLEEAKRIVASSPSRSSSPSRLASGSPKFAASQGQAARLSLSSALERRDPLARSARRYRGAENLSGEILSKSTAKHRRNTSDVPSDTPISPGSPHDPSPASSVHKWFSNMLKPSNPAQVPEQPISDPTPQSIPLRQPAHRRSRFQNDPSSPRPQGIPIPSRRTFQSSPSSTPDNNKLLSPPKNLVPSAQRRSISSSTCSVEKSATKLNLLVCQKDEAQALDQGDGLDDLNGFLKVQRTKIQKVLDDQVDSKAKIILSDPSNNTSTMVAAICYAWLLENRARKQNYEKSKAGNNNKEEDEEYVVVPVMNVRRGRMWKQREAAWLFYHVGIDTTSLLFSDEVDLESLMMAGKLSILVTGQDVLRINGDAGSHCTILTDNYCEDAYDLLDNPLLKKLLLAGILLDTQNLTTQLSMTRDAEAVQLLLVGLPSNYRNALFDQLTQHQGENSFLEALRQNYGKPPNEIGGDGVEHVKQKVSERKPPSNIRHEANAVPNSEKNAKDAKNAKRASPKSAKPSPARVQAPSNPPAQVTPDHNRGKNKFFLANWFGFGRK